MSQAKIISFHFTVEAGDPVKTLYDILWAGTLSLRKSGAHSRAPQGKKWVTGSTSSFCDISRPRLFGPVQMWSAMVMLSRAVGHKNNVTTSAERLVAEQGMSATQTLDKLGTSVDALERRLDEATCLQEATTVTTEPSRCGDDTHGYDSRRTKDRRGCEAEAEDTDGSR